MATSGSTNFELDVADYIEEAFERCGMESRTGYDLKTAKRSLNLVLADWANRGLNRWTIAQTTTSISSGTASYSLGADTIDVLGVIIRTGSGTTQSDQVLTRLSRDAYLTIPNKNTQAKPSQFYIDRQITPEIKLWPTPDDSYSIVYDRLTRMDDADTFINTMEVPFRFYPCLSAGLAYYLALKKAPERVALLKTVYEEEFKRAADEDRDRASLKLTPSRDYYTRS
jgi:hypothetical protein|tara:strand:+ start:15594 stop:16271 length:678 start_codon:yes stop_codon:yes gene_type:complete